MECAHGDLPPVIVVADTAQSYMTHAVSIRATDAVLVPPVTSSALFNAINAAVWRRYDGRERLLQTTTFDDRPAPWRATVPELIAHNIQTPREGANRILTKKAATAR